MGNLSYFDVEALGSLRGFLTPIHVGMNKCKTFTACHKQPDLHQQHCAGEKITLMVCVRVA